ncbi:hypothetical protein PISMIDRAFT_16892 [Pisolithus microcarpus 441]|uniref:Uncharacterized protein n=1 Tax=Pisolithus microcarpus 441 TaxID=765257 RepID=A0A0C9XRP1_9AGAM|nr:hypothetical protein BKA83DRAFT_16892 [Pisolithus microcarpus]KIK14940.1 hypothetical protein PISMIDRAFT_16892 [Pisolithus microcarpus 441]
MSLNEFVKNEAVLLPTDSEAIIMKLITSLDHLKSRTKMAIKDFDDAMKLFGKLYHRDGKISHKDASEKQMVKMAFNVFYPTYKSAKEELHEIYWSEEEWKVILKID